MDLEGVWGIDLSGVEPEGIDFEGESVFEVDSGTEFDSDSGAVVAAAAWVGSEAEPEFGVVGLRSVVCFLV